MKAPKPLLLTAMLAMTAFQPAQAAESWFATKFIGEFNAAYSGLEVAIPNVVFNDTNPADGYPESMTVKYDVYSFGTTTKRYSSAAKTIATPALGTCSNPEAAADNLDLIRTWAGRATTGTRVTVVMELSFECNGNDSSRTIVYSANVNAANGSSWKYESPIDHWLQAADGIDKTNPPDGNNDVLALMMTHDVPAGSNMRTVEIQFSNGTVVTNKDYPFIR